MLFLIHNNQNVKNLNSKLFKRFYSLDPRQTLAESVVEKRYTIIFSEWCASYSTGYTVSFFLLFHHRAEQGQLAGDAWENLDAFQLD
jgi:hypothetical protein